MQVLYVDDDPSLTKSVALMLRKAGHACDTADLGEPAVKLASRNDYDVIVLDIMLPDIDGYEVIERLREAQVSTPILIQTGLVDRAKPGAAEAFGVDDILLKPFNQDELISRLKRAASRAAESQAAPAEAAPSAAETPQDGGGGKRKAKRVRNIEACEIRFDGKKARGMVLNMSEGGAALRLPRHLAHCPKHFTLKLPAGRRYDCRICWRVRDKIGVAFV